MIFTVKARPRLILPGILAAQHAVPNLVVLVRHRSGVSRQRGGSHIGIVSFAGTATQDIGLTTSVEDLKQAADALVADGFTNHADAFTKATELLSASANNRVMVMFTDGVTTAGPDPSPVAAAARAMGITIYVIGLEGDTGLDEDALRDWASDPDVTHVAIAPDSGDLDEIFADLAANITIPGATNIVIDEALNPDFVITGAPVCSDVLVSCIRFILPDDGNGLCARRELQAKFMARYIDNDFSG